MVKESLNDIMKTFLHNAQGDIASVVYKVIEQVMLELLHKDIIGETLDDNITNFPTLTQPWAALEKISKLENIVGTYCYFPEMRKRFHREWEIILYGLGDLWINRYC